jgi:hypothetical protein
MGVAIYPNTASVIKSLQTGTAASAGTITISAVNTAKTVVHSISTGSAGTVAASGSINAANGSTSGVSFSAAYGNIDNYQGQSSVFVQGGNGGGLVYTVTPSGTYSLVYGRYGYVSANSNYFGMNQFMNAMNTNGMNVGLNSTSLTGGTTSLTAALYGATLTNSTTLTVTGPCTYQVIEYY